MIQPSLSIRNTSSSHDIPLPLVELNLIILTYSFTIINDHNYFYPEINKQSESIQNNPNLNLFNLRLYIYLSWSIYCTIRISFFSVPFLPLWDIISLLPHRFSLHAHKVSLRHFIYSKINWNLVSSVDSQGCLNVVNLCHLLLIIAEYK